jgi:predicted deacylase
MIPDISVIPLLNLASGDRLTLQRYRFMGARPGKKVYIQSNLHGAELAGNALIYQLLQNLAERPADDLQGELWIVPLCNPLGTNQRQHHFSTGRYNPYDGRDWNRIFWDYEDTILPEQLISFVRSHLRQPPEQIQHRYRQMILDAFQQQCDRHHAPQGTPLHERYRDRLQVLALDADYLIDLHTSSSDGMVYLYYAHQRQESARLFQLDAAILLDRYDGNAFDEAFIKPWLALERCFAAMGRPLQFEIEAWTLELGASLELQPDAVERGLHGVLNYLAAKEVLMTPGLPSANTVPMVLTTSSAIQKYYAPSGGMVIPLVSVGDRPTAGQPLYDLLQFDKNGAFPTTVRVQAKTPGIVYDLGKNRSVNEGEYVIGLIPMDVPTG